MSEVEVGYFFWRFDWEEVERDGVIEGDVRF